MEELEDTSLPRGSQRATLEVCLLDGWMDGWMDGLMMNGWMDGWMNG